MLGVTAEVQAVCEPSDSAAGDQNYQNKFGEKHFDINKLLLYSKAYERLAVACTDMVNSVYHNAIDYLPLLRQDRMQQQKSLEQAKAVHDSEQDCDIHTTEADDAPNDLSKRKKGKNGKKLRQEPEHRRKIKSSFRITRESDNDECA